MQGIVLFLWFIFYIDLEMLFYVDFNSVIAEITQFSAFIILVAPTVMVIPIFDQFDVYELFDTPECHAPRTVIATARGSKRFESRMTRFGGILQDLYFEDATGKDHSYYLDVAYYTPL